MGLLAMNIFDRSAVSQVRVARPTDRLDEIETFYQEAIGLPRITSWRDGIDGNHAGYDGLILGMPDGRYHLEFTHYRDGSPCPAPSRDNLLVFYLPDATGLDRVVARMKAYGHDEVEPENPWWRRDGGTAGRAHIRGPRRVAGRVHAWTWCGAGIRIRIRIRPAGRPSAAWHHAIRHRTGQGRVDAPMVASGNHG